MFKRNRVGIGIKITAGLLIFLVILALATSWLVAQGFTLAEQTAVQRTANSLQNQSQNSLIQLTALEAQLYNAELQKAANLTQIAAQYMVDAQPGVEQRNWNASPARIVWSSSQLTHSVDGLLYYDADPKRRTEILHPGNIPPDARTDRSLRDSAVLDELFPSLLAQTTTAVGIYFQGSQLTFRYYPVRNLPQLELENGAAEAAQKMHIEEFAVAPKNNPERKTVWLPPYVDDAGQGLLVSANTPIYYADEFQGYIGIDVSLSRLIEQLNHLKPTPTSFAFLTSADGHLIAAPSEDAALLVGRTFSQTQNTPTGLLGIDLAKANPELASALAAAQQLQTGATQIALDDQLMLVTYAPLADVGWHLSVIVPIGEVTAESQAVSQSIRKDGRETVRNTLLAMIALFLVASCASLLLSYRFLNRPLLHLLGGVRAVASGELDVTVPVNSRDELGELAESFNQMASKLHDRTQQLSATSAELQVKKAELKVAALEERQRLARDLHDSVSQALYGIALGARTALTQLQRDPTKVAEPLDYVLSLAEAGLSEMRALIFELRPESLQSEGLVAALKKQSDALQARHKLKLVTSFCTEPDVPLASKEMLYRVAQEAMHNVAKHANATQVNLSLRCDEQQLTLEIADNGKGFDPNGQFPGHLGLQSMRERVANLGGTLQIASQLGQGTTVTVDLPY
ncbi:MAG: histidine kinase [Caldilineaceae bacterium]